MKIIELVQEDATVNPQRSVVAYQIVDGQTDKVLKQYIVKSPEDQGRLRRQSHRLANKYDLQYGAIRYPVRTIWSDDTSKLIRK